MRGTLGQGLDHKASVGFVLVFFTTSLKDDFNLLKYNSNNKTLCVNGILKFYKWWTDFLFCILLSREST